MLGQTLVLMQMTFLNNARKVGRLVLSRTFLDFRFRFLSFSGEQNGNKLVKEVYSSVQITQR
jgi:hypothetical protein